MEKFADIEVVAGQNYSIQILMTNELLVDQVGSLSPGGVRLGGNELMDEDKAIDDAIQLARSVDVPILLVGLGSDFEYEASDRSDLLLPGRVNEMIHRVLRANSNTVIINQSGMPIEMPWINSASTVVQAWLGGQEAGHAIADVLFGDICPSGRLSVTFPKRIQDTPAYINFGKSDRTIVYGEGVFVGYRYYEKVDVRPEFYFGFGLSYTEFAYSNLAAPTAFSNINGEIQAEVAVDVTNTGQCNGMEVVQIYISDLHASIQRPHRELKAFSKVDLLRGESRTCRFLLDKYALSYWSEEEDAWKAEAGDFAVVIARSADPRDEVLRTTINLSETFCWSGL
ncbi:hypothetical protein CkaCkLH20_05562 [Colletotrichum karsti]|uniref:beta-glucosidase n=1 Tax=Colletotrichum karsti TaxID=1095194 RepID=A0A9P6I7U7_9PEZI|nr:uncharacterized protein CkaCkLH20_05562 [Colletotrichum karsti]KAF9876716.1 hypothetical protein CkaCkLH20_05562 [Colletotrichum karsti]